jgi:alanine racemase
MNMTMVDVTEVPGARVGSEATLIGHQGNEMISAAEVAGWADTIHYELLARLSPEIPRQVI